MSNVIVVIILLIVIGAAVSYIVKSKKKGVKCIGCPASGNCAGKHSKDSEQEIHKCGCQSKKSL